MGGIPLAIELVASRANAMSLEEMLDRLDDVLGLPAAIGRGGEAERHSTPAAALDWSYQFLSPVEQTLLRRLSVFSGGLTIAHAEDVCGGEPLEHGQILGLLIDLVDRSMVSVIIMQPDGATRYQLLDPVRDYAQGRLEASGEEQAVRRLHAEVYLGYAIDQEALLKSSDAKLGFRRLAGERLNILEALRWFIDSEDAERALRLVGIVTIVGTGGGEYAEHLRWLERTLAIGSGAAPEVKGWPYHQMAWAHVFLGDPIAGIAECSEAIRLLEHAPDRWRLGYALGSRAAMATMVGDMEGAMKFAEGSLQLARAIGDEFVEGNALGLMWVHALATGRHEETELAEARWRDAARKIDHWHMSVCLVRAATLYLASDPNRAVSLAREALSLSDGPEPYVTSGAVETLAAALALLHDSDKATRLLGCAEAMRESAGMTLPSIEPASYERIVAGLKDALGETHFAEAWSAGRAMSLGRTMQLAMAPNGSDG